jgi:hypothetical protein
MGLIVAADARRRAVRVVDACVDQVSGRIRADRGIGDGRAFRDFAVVHYDALRELSGGLSFSAALLNAAGDGIVLTTISGRSESRTYVKVVQGGRGVEMLSPEEDEAVRAARLGRGPALRLDRRTHTVRRRVPAPAPDTA